MVIDDEPEILPLWQEGLQPKGRVFDSTLFGVLRQQVCDIVVRHVILRRHTGAWKVDGAVDASFEFR